MFTKADPGKISSLENLAFCGRHQTHKIKRPPDKSASTQAHSPHLPFTISKPAPNEIILFHRAIAASARENSLPHGHPPIFLVHLRNVHISPSHYK
ncbi:hypothetical protein Zmor_024764 [Zophobas morio]|uniref:Uncharacterized protein n=1 Tax=Zophobas morio TaxID=2755281 RepID=A0AA38I154_9CUCU|nr:hypothetical protein Zmor_024764 [Zophobas morio]